MDVRFDDVIESTFRVKSEQGQDKVISLDEAIRRNVKPGMKLFIEEGANAAVSEIIRQFWGSRPKFTLIMAVVSSQAINLIHCGLAEKVITSICLEWRPTPGPSRAIQAAYKENRVDIEGWSLYSLCLRLMAGALGTGFMPTKSIIGTSMAEENKESFKVMDNPFGSGQRLGLVKALNPDVAIVHGLAADHYGNTIMSQGPKSGYSAWGPRASKNGTIVTVEKLVSTDFIRRHSTFVKLPGYMVNSVSVVPFGAHPEGLTNLGLGELESYGEDEDFMAQSRIASQSPQTLDAWLKEWVMDCKTHRDYLRKLGYERLLLLRGGADEDVWEHELGTLLRNVSASLEYNLIEMMIVASARKIREKAIKNSYRSLLVGTGTSALAAWIAYFKLIKEGYDIEVMNGPGFFGYTPRPVDPLLTNYSTIPTCKMLTDIIDTYGALVGGENNRCLAVVGAAQVDKYGNINAAKLAPGFYLMGSGGANDATNAQEVMIITHQSRHRFLEKLPYITSLGNNVKCMVSNLGVFEKLRNGEFTLTEYFPGQSTMEENISKVKENCGWDLKIADDIKEVTSPTLEELILLRILDPRGYFTKS
jgi:acyl CoA:acetate/3-ketoacid CoA transferase alpha subunit/acyl CoA:acetate/3-ketoacid CoA transferase beta subunit